MLNNSMRSWPNNKLLLLKLRLKLKPKPKLKLKHKLNDSANKLNLALHLLDLLRKCINNSNWDYNLLIHKLDLRIRQSSHHHI